MATPSRPLVPIACPICAAGEVQPVLRNLTIIATDPAQCQDRRVGGVAVFQCRGNGHVFFVRASDLDDDSPVDRRFGYHKVPVQIRSAHRSVESDRSLQDLCGLKGAVLSSIESLSSDAGAGRLASAKADGA